MTVAERILMEVIPDSKLGKEMIARESKKLVRAKSRAARARGVRDGIREGRLETAIGYASKLLTARFPTIETPDLSVIKDAIVAEQLFDGLLAAETPGDARKILKRIHNRLT